ncbi:MAG: VaFE repeat-containing surface-anchored protein [Ruminococcus flavefaciens]|nr:VaFE repeat-containing surface-anchored protein [Ruminococcus flavefaciens]
MCIPSGVISVASAEETGSTATTVTLADTENGMMQFSEECMENSTAEQSGYQMIQVNDEGEAEQIENDGSLWAFNKGDMVEVELISDEGYNVESFAIKAADTGDVMAQKKTTDNVFSFSMPAKSITVEAVFSNSSTVEIVPGDESSADGELDIASRYHDITEDEEVTQDEVEETMADLATESYIKSNLDAKYITLGDKFSIANILVVKNTLFDGRYVEDGDTIDSIMYSIENGTGDYETNILKVLGQVGSYVYVYDFNKDSDYYVAYANTMNKDDGYTVQDWQFATNDTLGNLLDGCVYDDNTGLFYIPKHLYMDINEQAEEENGIQLMSLQVQFMQVYNPDSSGNVSSEDIPELESDTYTVDIDEDNSTIDVDSDKQSVFALETVATVDKGLDENNLNVMVNGILVPEDVYEYDSETGKLTIEMSSASVFSIEVTEKEKTLSDHILSLTADEVRADRFDDMKSYGKTVSLTAKDFDTAKEHIPKKGELMKLKAKVTYPKGAKAGYNPDGVYNPWDGSGTYTAAVKKLAKVLQGESGVGNVKPYKTKLTWYTLHANLKHYKSANSDTWTQYNKFLKQIDIQLPCAHLGSSIIGGHHNGTRLVQDGRVNLRVVESKTTTNKADVKAGYVVFAILTTELNTQSGIGLFKMKWDWEGGGTEKVDPMRLRLYKVVKHGQEDKTISDATLSGAEFTVVFYEDAHVISARHAHNTMRTATATWVFSTKGPVRAGTDDFRDMMDTVDQKYNSESVIEPAGVEFTPINFEEDREKWNNHYLISDNIKSYRENWGKKGSYYIYESKAPSGFLLSGKMYPTDKDAFISTTAPDDGLVVYYEPPSEDQPDGYFEVNGSWTESGDLTVEQKPAAYLIVEENPDNPSMESDALCVDTNQQYVGNSGSVARIRDTITVHLAKNRQGTYTVSSALFDKTAGDFINVDWDPAFGEVSDESLGAEQAGDDGEMDKGSSISKVFSTDEVTVGSSHTITVEGNLPLAGLQGHTLVFMNTLFFETTTSPLDEPGDPEGDKKNLYSLESDEDDTREFIYVGNPSTDIVSDSTSRKSGTGESIIYAGKYKEGSVTEKGDKVLQTLTDTVHYENFQPGRYYTVKGYLVDTETKGAAIDANGTPIESVIAESTKQYQADSSGSGDWEVKFSFDATGCGGKKYVSFIEVYSGSTLVYSYKEINDSYESFYIPKISTKLTDKNTGENMSFAGSTITLKDTITYSKFMPNARYKVKTRLVDMETGETAKDANNEDITKETIITDIRNEDGEFEIELSFDTQPDKGHVYVAYEQIFIEQKQQNSNKWVLVADHEDLWDKDQRIYIPFITTEASDLKTDKRISFAENYMKINDVVHYEGLSPEHKYKLVSKLVDKATGRVVVDDDGKKQELTTYFYAEFNLSKNQYLTYGDIIPKAEGEDCTFVLNASSFAGKTFVIYEELYVENDTGSHIIATHKEIDDPKQTIQIPKIWTNAIDDETKTHVTYMGNGTSIITDTISYENLLVGEEYVVEGVLIDREKTLASGTPVAAIGPDGSACTVISDPFPATSANGTTKVSFEIDTARYEEQLKTQKSAVFVAYQELKIVKSREGSEDTAIVAEHKDIDDEDQTIYMPEITTELLDAGNGTHVVYAGKNARLKETINYYNMKPLTNYTVKGCLYNMETGKELTDSNNNAVKTETTMRSNASGTGTWTLTYNFDASKLQGTIIVAFAQVYIPNGENPSVLSIVADHDDFWDKEERVYIPELTTDAYDQKTDEQISLAEKTMKIMDTVHYKSLSPGYTYRLVSELRDQATGEVVVDNAGKTMVLTTEIKTDFELLDKQYLTYGDIIPKAPGTEATFEVDAEYFAGRTLVVFERLYIDNASGEHLVAEHQELLDERQTIQVPGIGSNAFDLDNFTKTSMAGGRATIIDTVSYNNLVPGWTYELQGYIVDKYQTIKAGTNVTVTGTDGKPAKNSIVFTPSTSSGTVRIAFEIDTSKYNSDEIEELQGAVFVVYQELYVIQRYEGDDDRSLVATHTDIGNLNQTIYIPYIWTDLNDYSTGTKVLNAAQDAHVVDTISYKRFQPNTVYTVKGRLIDMQTGGVLTDSSNNRVEKEMEVTTSDTGTGFWDLHYNFDASGLQGKVIVAYADVYVRNGERKEEEEGIKRKDEECF